MQLIVGTDSTWSLRTWLCGEIAGLDLDVKVVDLSKAEFKQQLTQLSPSALVPALNNGDLVVHDSLAIAEYLNELSAGALYPQEQNDRAIARALCNELHSGFFNLRSKCSFTLGQVEPADLSDEGVRLEVERVAEIFAQAQLPFMHAHAGAVDAFYAVLAYRLNSYGIYFKGKAGDYQTSLLQWDLMQTGIEQMTQWKKMT